MICPTPGSGTGWVVSPRWPCGSGALDAPEADQAHGPTARQTLAATTAWSSLPPRMISIRRDLGDPYREAIAGRDQFPAGDQFVSQADVDW